MNAYQLKKGQQGIVESFSDPELAGRMIEVGIIPGAAITRLSRAPFKGALLVEVNNHKIAVRKRELEAIEVRIAT